MTSRRRIARAVTVGPSEVEIQRSVRPALIPDHVVVEVEAVGLCGSDYHLFRGDNPYAHFPLVQGHEFVGVIAESAEGGGYPRGTRVVIEPTVFCGTCIACRRGRSNCCKYLEVFGVQRDGGLAEAILIPEHLVHPIGDMPAALAVLSEPVAVGFHCVDRAGVGPGDRVVVLGGGPIGLATLLAAEERGAEVMLVDRHAHRLDLARQLGAAAAHNIRGGVPVGLAVHDFTSGDGPVVVIEATGDTGMFRLAVDMVAPSGVVAVVGVASRDVNLSALDFTRKEMTVLGSRNTSGDIPHAVTFLSSRPFLEQLFVTHRASLDKTEKALAHASLHPDQVVKTVVSITP